MSSVECGVWSAGSRESRLGSGRILVTGADGFFGGHFVPTLPMDEQTILHCGLPGSVDAYRREGFSCVLTGDLAGGEAVWGLPEADVQTVVHLAGLPGGQEDDLIRANVSVTRNVVRWAASHSVQRIVFASTAAVYGDSCERPAKENDELAPQSPYAISKVRAEELLQEFSDNDGSVISLRIPHAYGAGKRVGVLAAILSRATAGETVVLDGSGEERRDFVHIDDVVSAFSAACEVALSTGFHAFNIGYGESISLREACRIVGEAVGREVSVGLSGKPAGQPHCIQLDVSKAAREMGWAPTIGLAEGVREMLGRVDSGEWAVGRRTLDEGIEENAKRKRTH